MELDLKDGTLDHLVFDASGRLRLDRVGGGYVPTGEVRSAVYNRKKTGAVMVTWTEQWTVPQRWNKYNGNPVFGPDQSGDWDTWTNGVSIVPSPYSKTYKMFYAGDAGEGIGIAAADMNAPTAWKELPGCPVLKPRADNWEGNKFSQPRVVIVTPEHWRMYYTGWGFSGPGTCWAMGLAESFDAGMTWRRHNDDPILTRGDADSADGGGACVPMVLRVAGRWMMWYTAGVVNPKENLNIHLCLAMSDDGLSWQKYEDNPVLGDSFSDDSARNVTSRCYVHHDEGVFQMWYSYANPTYKICYAESLDGIDWERSAVAPVLGPSPAPAWDDESVEYPEVQIVDGKYQMWFCGNPYGTVGYAEGVIETGVGIAIRSGETNAPDDTWIDWVTVDRGRAVKVSHFYQIRARLWSKNPLLSPSLNNISLHAPA